MGTHEGISSHELISLSQDFFPNLVSGSNSASNSSMCPLHVQSQSPLVLGDELQPPVMYSMSC
eukprot:2976126-Amphidinium_carterae.2